MMIHLEDGIPEGDPVIPDYGEASQCVIDNGLFCPSWFADQWSSVFWPPLLMHIFMVVVAIVVGFAIAFALALISYRRKWLTGPVRGVTTFLYTLPPLAVFQLLVPISGLTMWTVEIALVMFTLMLIFQAVLAGLDSVSADVKKAAIGMGLDRGEVFRKVELPLAVPSIVSGVRIATVLTVSIATIAAFVVDAGLGSPILKAVSSPFNTQFIGAGLLAVLLALALDGILVLIGKALTPWTRVKM
jgi:osmoprotectant transport system permease protein